MRDTRQFVFFLTFLAIGAVAASAFAHSGDISDAYRKEAETAFVQYAWRDAKKARVQLDRLVEKGFPKAAEAALEFFAGERATEIVLLGLRYPADGKRLPRALPIRAKAAELLARTPLETRHGVAILRAVEWTLRKEAGGLANERYLQRIRRSGVGALAKITGQDMGWMDWKDFAQFRRALRQSRKWLTAKGFDLPPPPPEAVLDEDKELTPLAEKPPDKGREPVALHAGGPPEDADGGAGGLLIGAILLCTGVAVGAVWLSRRQARQG